MRHFLILFFISLIGCSVTDDEVIEIETIRFEDEVDTQEEPIRQEEKDLCPEFCLKLWNDCVDAAEEACGNYPYPPEIWTACESKSYYQTCNHLEDGCLLECHEDKNEG